MKKRKTNGMEKKCGQVKKEKETEIQVQAGMRITVYVCVPRRQVGVEVCFNPSDGECPFIYIYIFLISNIVRWQIFRIQERNCNIFKTYKNIFNKTTQKCSKSLLQCFTNR